MFGIDHDRRLHRPAGGGGELGHRAALRHAGRRADDRQPRRVGGVDRELRGADRCASAARDAACDAGDAPSRTRRARRRAARLRHAALASGRCERTAQAPARVQRPRSATVRRAVVMMPPVMPPPRASRRAVRKRKVSSRPGRIDRSVAHLDARPRSSAAAHRGLGLGGALDDADVESGAENGCTSTTPGTPASAAVAAARSAVASTSTIAPGSSSRDRAGPARRRARGPSCMSTHARAALGLVEVGRGDDQGEPVGDQLGEQPPELAPGHRVDAGGGLVEQQHLGRVHEGAGERQLLLHAAREAVGRRGRGTRARPTRSSSSSRRARQTVTP